jgi:hypothetical protein
MIGWSDINFFTMEVAVTRSCARNRFGAVKTEANGKPVSLHQSVSDVLAEWRGKSEYGSDNDFLFPSLRKNGEQPLMSDMVLKKIVLPSFERGSRGRSSAGTRSDTAWRPISAVWEWTSRSHRNCLDTPTLAPRWTSTRTLFPQISEVRVKGRLNCCWLDVGKGLKFRTVAYRGL